MIKYVVARNHQQFCRYLENRNLQTNSEYIYLGSEINILGLRLNKDTELIKLEGWRASKSLYFINRILILESFKE